MIAGGHNDNCGLVGFVESGILGFLWMVPYHSQKAIGRREGDKCLSEPDLVGKQLNLATLVGRAGKRRQ